MTVLTNRRITKSILQNMFNDTLLFLSKPTVEDTTNPLIIAGYASVSVVDSENHIIPVDVLHPALSSFMKKAEFRNVMVEHSSLQVGTVIEEYTAANGRVYKTHVDENGLFVVIQIRDPEDLTAVKEVRDAILDGRLRSFSIAGIAKPGERIGDSSIISLKALELFEITICRQGKNPLAKFDVIAKALAANGQNLSQLALSDVASNYQQPITLVPMFMNITGDIVSDSITQGDVEIMLRANKDAWIDGVLASNILSILPQDIQERIALSYSTDSKGPYEEFMPVYDLALIPSSNYGKVVRLSETNAKTTTDKQYLLDETRKLLNNYFDVQEASVIVQLRKEYSTYFDLENLIAQSLDSNWEGATQEYASRIVPLSVGYGDSLAASFPGDTVEDVVHRVDLQLSITPDHNSAVNSHLSSSFDTIGQTTRRIILKSLYDLSKEPEFLNKFASKVQQLFSEWRETNGRIDSLTGFNVDNCVNSGMLLRYGINGSKSVLVMDSDSNCLCSHCSNSHGKVWSIGYSLVNTKAHPRCSRFFIDAGYTLPSV